MANPAYITRPVTQVFYIPRADEKIDEDDKYKYMIDGLGLLRYRMIPIESLHLHTYIFVRRSSTIEEAENFSGTIVTPYEDFIVVGDPEETEFSPGNHKYDGHPNISRKSANEAGGPAQLGFKWGNNPYSGGSRGGGGGSSGVGGSDGPSAPAQDNTIAIWNRGFRYLKILKWEQYQRGGFYIVIQYMGLIPSDDPENDDSNVIVHKPKPYIPQPVDGVIIDTLPDGSYVIRFGDDPDEPEFRTDTIESIKITKNNLTRGVAVNVSIRDGYADKTEVIVNKLNEQRELTYGTDIYWKISAGKTQLVWTESAALKIGDTLSVTFYPQYEVEKDDTATPLLPGIGQFVDIVVPSDLGEYSEVDYYNTPPGEGNDYSSKIYPKYDPDELCNGKVEQKIGPELKIEVEHSWQYLLGILFDGKPLVSKENPAWTLNNILINAKGNPVELYRDISDSKSNFWVRTYGQNGIFINIFPKFTESIKIGYHVIRLIFNDGFADFKLAVYPYEGNDNILPVPLSLSTDHLKIGQIEGFEPIPSELLKFYGVKAKYGENSNYICPFVRQQDMIAPDDYEPEDEFKYKIYKAKNRELSGSFLEFAPEDIPPFVVAAACPDGDNCEAFNFDDKYKLLFLTVNDDVDKTRHYHFYVPTDEWETLLETKFKDCGRDFWDKYWDGEADIK